MPKLVDWGLSLSNGNQLLDTDYPFPNLGLHVMVFYFVLIYSQLLPNESSSLYFMNKILKKLLCVSHAASQYSNEIAHSEMHAAEPTQRNQRESPAVRYARPAPSPGQHSLSSGPDKISTCSIALKPNNLGPPLQLPSRGVSQ